MDIIQEFNLLKKKIIYEYQHINGCDINENMNILDKMLLQEIIKKIVDKHFDKHKIIE